ncbi:poly(ethylene terephthalate) hydrolase family protein [Nocardioides mangrovi]|uniref:Dienelactone hydrolase n=1 Tax=Nocardioides mangrovi TaxID=2874580 RepID=A0ABS7UIK0_9ACTN|nr:hypothetical protein [Nocardioides mangrovi]MBZ5740458.1 hypothetical protein [Nocardioides mangrovi]
MRARAHAVATLVASLVAVVTLGPALAPSAAAPRPTTAARWATVAVTTADYDLGVRHFDQAGEGAFAKVPIRLWGSISVPTGPGPYPVVVISHGAHGDGCREIDLATEWPCWQREQRNDLGLGYLGRRLAQLGVVAVAPDVNAAYTFGWGELNERRRYSDIVSTILQELQASSDGTAPADQFGVDLTGKVDTQRIALVGHSRGGFNSVRWAKSHPEVRSLFLAAPYDGGWHLPDIPTTVTVGTCDGDTGDTGATYVERSRADQRTTPMVLLTARRANHNWFNRTVVALHHDDATASEPGCARDRRPRPGEQQRWLARVVGDHLKATFLDPPKVRAYLQQDGSHTVRLEHVSTTVRVYRPRA